MNMFDEARAMSGTLLLCKITQRELAKRLGVSQSYIANKLRLLSFSPEMQKRIVEGGVSERHARAILSLEESDRHELIERVISQSLTVRECEALVEIRRTAKSPKRIRDSGKGDGIDAFYRAIRGGVQMLSSLGIEARERTTYDGDKMYITICICNT